MSRIEILDSGYVSLVESWGCDERIVEAARMSTDKGFQGWGPRHEPDCPWQSYPVGYQTPKDKVLISRLVCCTCPGKPGDEGLLRYLYEHKHATPFEMAGLIVDVQAPIFVFREWHRHRTQSYNEMSARYTPLPDVNYIPTVGRLMLNAGGSNKQAGTVVGAATLTVEGAYRFREVLRLIYTEQEAIYRDALKEGVPKELARIHLPVGRYSRMRASANLRNWLAFLTLRMAPDAQWEIQQYANAVGSLIAEEFPRTWALFEDGQRKGRA